MSRSRSRRGRDRAGESFGPSALPPWNATLGAWDAVLFTDETPASLPLAAIEDRRLYVPGGGPGHRAPARLLSGGPARLRAAPRRRAGGVLPPRRREALYGPSKALDGRFRSPSGALDVFGRRVDRLWNEATPPWDIRFRTPDQVLVCLRRKIRRQVLHALMRLNSGRGRRRPQGYYSEVHCK